ncbi:MAG: class II fructose-bisphosphate aldolase [Desulfovibrio sp.]|uniref:class II fructose-bisphosphate aldolase n=1 Tax=Desulfovibrio sp. 7SRBS1 TaxID=3378064 RepID=UPI003B41B791
MALSSRYTEKFDQALSVGRPPNIRKLFPNSRALIVSGKVIDRAMISKGKAMTIAANGRNRSVIRGALKAAQQAGAAIILEIAKSECTYCPTNFWNLAMQADQAMNELGITVPVAIHADHYGIKNRADVDAALDEIPTLFEAGITSIAIDASHLPDADNLLANLELAPLIPKWAGYETEVGEIKGKAGLSTPEEALFLIRGLNAYSLYPDWIALNNGTTHGIEESDTGISVPLTAEIHEALASFGVSGAQHGTSGNNSDRLRDIAANTKTTKANVATALQMISWGVSVNDYGNAVFNRSGDFDKVEGKGVTARIWERMTTYAQKQGWNGGGYKKLNLPFENAVLGQPEKVRQRMEDGVQRFVHHLLVDVFNAEDTAETALDIILRAESFDLGPKASTLEDPLQWTEKKIRERAATLDTDKGPQGDYDD